MRDDDGRLGVETEPQPRYTLADLLAASDHTAPLSAEEREWIEAPPVGKEIG